MSLSPLIELQDVSKVFTLESEAEIKVLQGVNLSIFEDEVVALLGPSGSGKSTCLRIMAGLIEPTAGRVLTRSRDLQGINPDVSLVFQSFALFPWETVYENIALALKPLQVPPREMRERVQMAIDLVGLEGFEEAFPRELSGGMKQRVGIARALVMQRPVLVLDEPFSALDVLTADTLRTEIIRIFLGKKTPTRSMVLVTHNIQEAVLLARRILVMGVNPGHIRHEITNDLAYPRSEDSLAFTRMVSQIHGFITEALMPDVQPGIPGAVSSYQPRGSVVQILPNVQVNEVIGLLETIAAEGGRIDVFELAQNIGKEFGQTLYLVKAAELFEFVDTPKNIVSVTELGQRFIAGDINNRKRMLHEGFGKLTIVQMLAKLLKTSDTLRMPIDVVEEQLGKWLPNENPESTMEILISWGRFAEYFGYNDPTREIYLDVGQETA
jgi:NitT/TauT family transport system ATP-binding protein